MLVLDIGCGSKKTKGSIGIDITQSGGVDIVHDVNKGLPMIDSNSVDRIHCYHSLEHLKDVECVMKELYRILKNKGKIFIRVPHFSSRIAHDIHHKVFFCSLSFDYLDRDTWIGQYDHSERPCFKIIKKKITLYSSVEILR